MIFEVDNELPADLEMARPQIHADFTSNRHNSLPGSSPQEKFTIEMWLIAMVCSKIHSEYTITQNKTETTSGSQ